MKYCAKCGYQMEDDMLFCQSCGTKFVEVKGTSVYREGLSREVDSTKEYTPQSNTSTVHKPRRFLKFLSGFCLFSAALMLLMSFAVDHTMMVAVLIYGIFGIMFLLLSKTPKKSVYLLGKNKGIKKSLFVWGCIFFVFASVIIFASNSCTHEYVLSKTKPSTCTEDGLKTYICELCDNKKFETIVANGHAMENGVCSICGYVGEIAVDEPDENIESDSADQNVKVDTEEMSDKLTMGDIEAWYVADIPAVSKMLAEYAPTKVNGLSNFEIMEGKFFFGKDGGWVDCNYTIYFECVVNGEKCIGEARAFREYMSDSVYWFHFEIVKDSDWSIIIEEYDDNCDAMMEKHYAELETLAQ